MASTVWKGHLSFGLVSIPVRLVRAARAERVKLRQLYRPDAAATPFPVARDSSKPAATDALQESSPPIAPVHRTYQVAKDDGAPIGSGNLVKGYEYTKGEYVVLEDEEIRAIMPKTSTEMQ